MTADNIDNLRSRAIAKCDHELAKMRDFVLNVKGEKAFAEGLNKVVDFYNDMHDNAADQYDATLAAILNIGIHQAYRYIHECEDEEATP